MVETQPEVPSAWRVGAVARLAGVTVRTLHHYDQIGLLSPTGRSEAGYRRDSEADLERLQQILFYRELGFGLDEIREVTTQRDGDVVAHLRRQHALLLERIKLLRPMAAAVEKALEARSMGIKLTPEEQFEVFGEHRQSDLDAEVMQRWGDTDAYRESRRRTSAPSWVRMVRATMLEVLSQDYVRTARAKGVRHRVVVYRHALRNALIPVVTIIGFEIGILMGGAAIVEIIFGLPGVGYVLLQSIFNRDYPVVQGATLLIAVIFVVANTIVDIVYGWLDPRISHG